MSILYQDDFYSCGLAGFARRLDWERLVEEIGLSRLSFEDGGYVVDLSSLAQMAVPAEGAELGRPGFPAFSQAPEPVSVEDEAAARGWPKWAFPTTFRGCRSPAAEDEGFWPGGEPAP
ncbi:MAG: hypothetical protein U1E52_05970 [Geminicoccaceae bacterium]